MIDPDEDSLIDDEAPILLDDDGGLPSWDW